MPAYDSLGRHPRACVGLFAGLAIAGLCHVASANAQDTSDVLKLGYLTDMTGVAASVDGPGGADAAQMAIDDFGGKVAGRHIQLIVADHQNNTDTGMAIARRWYDTEGVRVILDADYTPVALGIQSLAREKDRIGIFTVGTSDITGKGCSPNGIQWSLDAYAETHAVSTAVTQAGERSWFYITVDYGFGHSLEAESRAAVQAAGGTVVGHALHPYNVGDVSAYVLQAKASGAQIIGLADAVQDMVNVVKEAHAFGMITPGRNPFVAFTTYEPDIRAIGLDAAQGLRTPAAFYWDRDDQTRAWSQRYFARNHAMPTSLQAAAYSMTLHYLRSVQAAGTDQTAPVLDKMHTLHIHDPAIRDGWVRADGRTMYDISLLQVKAPDESNGPWDLYKIVGTIPADQAFMPASQSQCPLLRQ